jgi:hypothetical protein
MNHTDRDAKCYEILTSSRNRMIVAIFLGIAIFCVFCLGTFIRSRALEHLFVGHYVPRKLLLFDSVISTIAIIGAMCVLRVWRRINAYLQPGHWILLIAVPGIVLDWLACLILGALSDNIQFARNIPTVAMIMCVIVSGIGFTVAAILGKICSAWRGVFIFEAGLSFVIAITGIWPFQHLELVDRIGAYIGILLIIVAVVGDHFLPQRRDYLHYIGIGYLAIVFIRAIIIW